MNEMVRMRHPDGYSCGWNSIAYEPDENRIVTVDHAAVADLQNFGFRIVPDEPALADQEFGGWPQGTAETPFALGEAGPELLVADIKSEHFLPIDKTGMNEADLPKISADGAMDGERCAVDGYREPEPDVEEPKRYRVRK